MRTLQVDYSRVSGAIRPLHGVNNGPLNWGGLTDLSPFHAELGVPYTRLHDPHWPNPDVVDINAVFPDFDADPSDPASYTFARSDDYIAAIVKLGSQIIYRLGHGIEHTARKFHTLPPADYARWAQICLGIIRHYNEGWADGFHWGIRNWEIWNEPDIPSSPAAPSPTWGGTRDDYFRLYAVAAKAIKTHDAALNVCGPAMTGGGVGSGFLAAFLQYCRENAVPLDVCTWHHYTWNPGEIVELATAVRRLLDESGFAQTRSNINEWNYIPPHMDWNVLFHSPDPRVPRRLAHEINGATGAAFAAAVLIYLQDCPVDIANYYLADTLPYFSMFDTYGVPLPPYYAFKAFRRLLDAPQRALSAGNDLQTGVAICGGLAGDGRSAAILLSNQRAPEDRFVTSVLNLPWDKGARCDLYLVDAKHEMEQVKTEWFGAPSFRIIERVPPASVLLYQLTPGS